MLNHICLFSVVFKFVRCGFSFVENLNCDKRLVHRAEFFHKKYVFVCSALPPKLLCGEIFIYTLCLIFFCNFVISLGLDLVVIEKKNYIETFSPPFEIKKKTTTNKSLLLVFCSRIEILKFELPPLFFPLLCCVTSLYPNFYQIIPSTLYASM